MLSAGSLHSGVFVVGRNTVDAAYPVLLAPCEVVHLLGGLLAFGLAWGAYRMMPTPSEGVLLRFGWH